MILISCYYVQLSGCYPSLFTITWEQWANVRQMLQSSSQWSILWQEVVIYMCTYTLCAVREDLKLPSSTTFYACRMEALARFFFLAALRKLALCQSKPKVYQQVTFSNIRPLSKWKYAAAYFNSDEQPTALTYSSPPYLQPRRIQRRHFKPICLPLPSLLNIFHLLQKNMRWRVDCFPHIPSRFHNPSFCAFSLSLSLVVFFLLSCTFELFSP